MKREASDNRTSRKHLRTDGCERPLRRRYADLERARAKQAIRNMMAGNVEPEEVTA